MLREYDADEYVVLLNKHRCKFSNVVGFCHNLSHRGYINKPLLKSHECIEKQCPLFARRNPNYWEQIEKASADAQKRRERAKQKKSREMERDEFIRNVFKAYNQIYITSIIKTEYSLTITYIYDQRVDLSEAITALREKFKCSIYLKAVRSSEENRRQLIRKGRDNTKTDLLTIPGVGRNMKQRLENIGYHCVEDLMGEKPQDIYEKDCAFQGRRVDRCSLYVYRLAVAYAENRINDPERLKWWNWKDTS